MTARRVAVVALLTDFGLGDTYVGQMKGVLATLAPDATVIDITHGVRPGAVEQGAFLLESAVAAFPPETVFLAVVDPGVGTARRALAVRAGGRWYVGPDNGLLSVALPDATRPAEPDTVPIAPDVQAVMLTGEPGRAMSATFHGRDLFAVAAARLATGATLASLGASAAHMQALPPFRAVIAEPGVLAGHVVHIDRFGNVITTIRAMDLTAPLRTLTVGGTRIARVVRTYGEGNGLVVLTGSSGFLEAAEVNGSAAARLGADIGMAVLAECAMKTEVDTHG